MKRKIPNNLNKENVRSAQMKNIWITSDTHFWHENVIKFCNRPYSSVEEMNEGLIENWNSVVKPTDHVYHLGDFSMKCDTQSVINILKRLNGHKYFIWGNHDKVVKDEALQYFVWTKHIHEMKICGQWFVMCHFPFESWHRSYYGSIHMHGHCHRDLPTSATIRRMDVGVDSNNYKPISLEEVYEKMIKRPVAKF